jgi:hypothetical protein
MRQSASRLRLCAVAAAAFAFLWASGATAAPAGEKHCVMAHGWVQDHCGGTSKVAMSREGTLARCARARTWIDEHCSGKADVSDRLAYRSKAKDYNDDEAARYTPRHHKHARKSRARLVYVYVERPRACCYSAPVTYYQEPRVRGAVYYSDPGFRPLGRSFWKAYENNLP